MKITDLIPGKTILIYKSTKTPVKVKVMAKGINEVCISQYDNYKQLFRVIDFEELSATFKIFDNPEEYIIVPEGYYKNLNIKVITLEENILIRREKIRCLLNYFRNKIKIFDSKDYSNDYTIDGSRYKVVALKSDIENCKI